MTSTRNQNAITAIEHILVQVLGEDPKPDDAREWGPYRQAFDMAGIASINDLLVLRESDFKEIEIPTYTVNASDPDNPAMVKGPDRKLKLLERRNLEQLQLWHFNFSQENPRIPAVR